MAQVPDSTQAAKPAQAAAPEPPEDALVRLFNQLQPISQGLSAQARKDPKGFIMRLPRMISGTIVQGMLTLIEEVGARDQDHESRLVQLERHPMLNLGDDYDDDVPDPNDPRILNAMLADVLAYMDILSGLAEKMPDLLGGNEAVQRIAVNRQMVEGMRAGIAYVLEQMAADEDEDEDEDEEGDGDEDEEAPEAGAQSAQTPTSSAPADDLTPPEIDPVAEAVGQGEVPPEAKPEAAQGQTSTEEGADAQVDAAPKAE